MAQFNVNQGNIDWIVKRLNDAMGNGQFSTAEVILGVAEYAGRMIVAIADTPVQGMQCAQLMTQHIGTAVRAGYTAKGYNMDQEQ